MQPTSEPGLNPSGIVLTHPVRPSRAMRSMWGCFATSSGVLSPSASMGTSLTPSGKITIYFIAVTIDECRLSNVESVPPTLDTRHSTLAPSCPHRQRHDSTQLFHDPWDDLKRSIDVRIGGLLTQRKHQRPLRLLIRQPHGLEHR